MRGLLTIALGLAATAVSAGDVSAGEPPTRSVAATPEEPGLPLAPAGPKAPSAPAASTAQPAAVAAPAAEFRFDALRFDGRVTGPLALVSYGQRRVARAPLHSLRADFTARIFETLEDRALHANR